MCSARLNKIVSILSMTAVATALALSVISCSQNSNTGNADVKGLTQEDANRLNSNSRFASTDKDPPLSADTHFAAGQLKESQEQYDAALAQYQQALKINPKHEPSLYRTGVVYTRLKQYPQAIETWKRYVAATNGTAIGYSNLAFCYELAGMMPEAEATYQQAISKDPQCKPARNNYGLMLARTGRVNQALVQLEAVFKPAEAQYNVASVLEQIGKKDEARQHYNEALKLDPNFIEAKKRLAAIN